MMRSRKKKIRQMELQKAKLQAWLDEHGSDGMYYDAALCAQLTLPGAAMSFNPQDIPSVTRHLDALYQKTFGNEQFQKELLTISDNLSFI